MTFVHKDEELKESSKLLQDSCQIQGFSEVLKNVKTVVRFSYVEYGQMQKKSPLIKKL